MRCGAIVREGRTIVPQAWLADRPWNRLRGLLGRKPLNDVQALWLNPCGSVHTFGMGYPLDLVFLDRRGCVLDWCERVAPWRARGCRGARQTVELAAGALRALSPQQGEQWQWLADH